MNAPDRNGHSQAKTNPRYTYMRAAVMASVLVHVIVMVVLLVGMPYIKPPVKAPEMISVELATIADITQTNKPPVKAPEPEEKKDEPAKKTPPKPVMSTDVPKPKPPDKKPVEVKAETPEQDELAPPKKDEKKDVKKPEEKKEDPAQFQSLLKNWAKNEPEQKTDIDDLTKKITAATPSPETAHIGAEMTMSDMDALRQQLSGCWNVFAGAAEAGDLAVDVRVQVNPDRTVIDAKIMDTGRYNSDARFRAAADSALRAVRDPRCSPLRLPPEKYDLWRDMVIVFDPKEML